MMYAERAYFDGDHCQHVADRDEQARLNRAWRQSSEAQRLRINRAWEMERAAMNMARATQ